MRQADNVSIYSSGGLVRGSLPGYRQADSAAEGRKARIVLIAQDEGVEKDGLNTRIAAAPGPIEPLEGRLRIVAQRVNLRDLEGSAVGPLADLLSSAAVATRPTPDL
jgi:hypothetical protein